MTWETIWRESFDAEIETVQSKSGSNPFDWRRGGRSTKENPNKEDGNWFEIWVSPEGVPGIEIGFNNLFGDVPIKAFADAVVMSGNELTVIDFKTGSYMPDSSLQLGVYASLMEMQFGVRPTKGYYYSARKAQFIESPGIERWTIPVLTEMFRQFNLGIENKIFLPNIGMSCGTCGVKEYCYAVGGQLAEIFDPLSQIK
jgi:RecB family exonuclease